MKSTRLVIVTTAFATLFMGLIFQACKKDSNSSSSSSGETDAVTMSSASSSTTDAYNDALNLALQTGVDGSTASTGFDPGTSSSGSRPVIVTGAGSSIAACATITVSPADTVSYPKTVVIDFGSGCTDANGVTRKGSITYVFSGKILQSGTTVSVTFTGYSVNGYQLGGTYSITNNSSGDGVNFVTTVTNGQVTVPDGTSYTYSGTRTVTQTAGAGTLSLLDNEYSIIGVHSFSSSAGKTLTDSVSTPLVWKTTCPHIVSGTIDFTYGYGNITLKGTFDYGDGDCDATATVKVGATTKTVTLP